MLSSILREDIREGAKIQKIEINLGNNHTPCTQNSRICTRYSFPLRLNESDYYRDNILTSNNFRHRAGAQFINCLIENRELESTRPTQGCLVIYMGNNRPAHAGILENAQRLTIKSMWDTLPAFFEHEIWMIPGLPESYGSSVYYYRRPEIEELYRKYISSLSLNN